MHIFDSLGVDWNAKMVEEMAEFLECYTAEITRQAMESAMAMYKTKNVEGLDIEVKVKPRG